MNTHHRRKYFLTNKIFLLQVMYRYVRTIFVVKCVTITGFFSLLVQRFDGKAWFFITLSSLETVHDTVKYRYCIFSSLNRLLRIRLKRQNPLLSYVRQREREREQKYTANVQRSVQYILLLLHLMLITFYCA